jgi:hypothetical protein
MALKEKRGVWPIHKACNKLWGRICTAKCGDLSRAKERLALKSRDGTNEKSLYHPRLFLSDLLLFVGG